LNAPEVLRDNALDRIPLEQIVKAVPFALQLYSVRDHLEKDLAGTLRRVKAVGYDYVETAGTYDLDAAGFKALLEQCGLRAVSAHMDLETVTQRTENAIADAHALGVRYVVMPWTDPALMLDKASWVACGKALDAAGMAFRAAGIRLGYHNHEHEFVRFDGASALDILMGAASAENLFAQIDCYWVSYGHADPAALIRRYKGRCPLIHVKDMAAGEGRDVTEIGNGIIDWRKVFAAGVEAGTEWYVVEQDHSRTDSIESARTSAAFMARQSLS
jgi:sugar phosphate isomerase/epimerase